MMAVSLTHGVVWSQTVVLHIRVPPHSPYQMLAEGLFAELKKHVHDLIYAKAKYLDKPMQLMAAAVGCLTVGKISGHFQRMVDQVAELLFRVSQCVLDIGFVVGRLSATRDSLFSLSGMRSLFVPASVSYAVLCCLP